MKNIKLEYIIEPSNHLYELNFINGKNLEDGFVARLKPMYLNSDEPIFKLQGTKFELIEGIKFNDFPIRRPDIEVTICVNAGEFSESDIMKVDEYMTNLLRNPFKNKGQ